VLSETGCRVPAKCNNGDEMETRKQDANPVLGRVIGAVGTFVSAIGSLVSIGLQVTPQTAKSNFSAWLGELGADRVLTWLVDISSHRGMFLLAGIAIGYWLFRSGDPKRILQFLSRIYRPISEGVSSPSSASTQFPTTVGGPRMATNIDEVSRRDAFIANDHMSLSNSLKDLTKDLACHLKIEFADPRHKALALHLKAIFDLAGWYVDMSESPIDRRPHSTEHHVCIKLCGVNAVFVRSVALLLETNGLPRISQEQKLSQVPRDNQKFPFIQKSIDIIIGHDE